MDVDDRQRIIQLTAAIKQQKEVRKASKKLEHELRIARKAILDKNKETKE